jgi:uncharacterized protein
VSASLRGVEYVVFYVILPGVDRDRLVEAYPRHEAYFQQFKAAGGGLTALGPFVTPDPTAASMGIFVSREDAEAFIAADPFVIEGLADARIVDWNVVRFE